MYRYCWKYIIIIYNFVYLDTEKCNLIYSIMKGEYKKSNSCLSFHSIILNYINIYIVFPHE